MKKPVLNILLVEDDPYFSFEVSKILKDFGICEIAGFTSHALDLTNKQHFDLAIIDINLGDNEERGGLDVLQTCKKKGIYSIVLSNDDDDENLKKAYQIGCDHYLKKNLFKESIPKYLNKFLTLNKNSKWNTFFKDQFITENKDLKSKIKSLINNYDRDLSLLITGDTGVGKTHFAKSLHKLVNITGDFISLNCSQIPENLIESELFGYEKGAFTGADSPKKGLLELAHNGTLFLDEIGTMPLQCQKKLLKAIEEKEFYPLGSEKKVSSNFSLISATCEDLKVKISNKDFREDFYFRIAGFEFKIPSLKERPEDTKSQIFSMLSKLERKIFLEESALHSLLEYNWPGNSRELKQVIKKIAYSENGIINSNNSIIKSLNVEHDESNSILNSKHFNYVAKIGLKTFIEQIEKETILHFNKLLNYKSTEIIKKLDISNSAYYRIKSKL